MEKYRGDGVAGLRAAAAEGPFMVKMRGRNIFNGLFRVQ